jgi:hypothetical protein
MMMMMMMMMMMIMIMIIIIIIINETLLVELNRGMLNHPISLIQMINKISFCEAPASQK